MAKIKSVEVSAFAYTVTYESGTVRTGDLEKMPGTVKAWLEENQKPAEDIVSSLKKTIEEAKTVMPEPEKIDLDDDIQTAYLDLYATWYEPDADPDPDPEPQRNYDEAVEIILPSLIKNPEYHDTPIPPRPEDPPKDPPSPSQGSPNQGSYRRASEAVAFGICMAFAVLAHGLIELVSLLAIMIDTGWALAKPRAMAGCILLARWLVAKAKAMADSLPEVTTMRGLLIAVRVLPVLIGLIALT